MRLVVMGSGQGSNFEAIDRAIASGKLPAQIALVISDKPDTPILAKARAVEFPPPTSRLMIRANCSPPWSKSPPI
ncbi:formyltransferase family protein [Oscillatoria laete-virens NRMC-F 0139]|nr:formyltransferase family protein [Oscillatoria laete-virens NRMC-F 0139]